MSLKYQKNGNFTRECLVFLVVTGQTCDKNIMGKIGLFLCYNSTMNEIGTLYVVATPIGNLEDITLRALRVLGEVDYILCEDTRTTQTLLNKYDIKAKTMSYHAHSTDGKEATIINLLKSGKNTLFLHFKAFAFLLF